MQQKQQLIHLEAFLSKMVSYVTRKGYYYKLTNIGPKVILKPWNVFPISGTKAEAVHGHLLYSWDDSLGCGKWFFHPKWHRLWSSSPLQGRLGQYVLNVFYVTCASYRPVVFDCFLAPGFFSWRLRNLLGSLKVSQGLSWIEQEQDNTCFSAWSWEPAFPVTGN